MSLHSFFAQQRQRWLAEALAPTAAPHPYAYQAGGLAALAQAEQAFAGLPLVNAHQEKAAVERELDDALYQVYLLRKQLKAAEARLAAPPTQTPEELARDWHHQQAVRMRKVLRRVAAVVAQPGQAPDDKLSRLRAMLLSFLDTLLAEELAATYGYEATGETADEV